VSDRTLADLLEGADALPALWDSKVRWTRGELRAATSCVATGLWRAGVRPGDRVAIAARGDARAVAALLGARAVGALTCVLEPRRAALLLPALKARAVISDGAVQEAGVLDLTGLLREAAGPLRPQEGPAESWGLSTSGTSGLPRTVVLRRESVAHITESIQGLAGYRETDRILCCPPFHHIYGLSQLWLALRSRALLLIPPSPMLPGDILSWSRQATLVAAIPAFVRHMMAAPERPTPRLVTLAGQATIPEDRLAFAAAFPDTQFLQFYGLTEAFRSLWLPADEFTRYPEATGRPTPGMSAWVDEEGELWLEGPNVAAGYLDDPEETARRFPGGRLRTGDLFKLEHGLFSFLGRRDGVFKSFGEKVVPEVVERAVQAHPGVERCLVTAEQGAGGELRSIAWVVPRGEPPAVAELLRVIRERVPAAMVPARVEFVPSLPATASGKVLRRAPHA
jgi:acyl-CoA synthetase (AMP-forming)/AMP-acid ligase II